MLATGEQLIIYEHTVRVAVEHLHSFWLGLKLGCCPSSGLTWTQ